MIARRHVALLSMDDDMPRRMLPTDPASRPSTTLIVVAFAVMCAAWLSLSGCSTVPRPAPLDPTALRQFEARGYPAPHQYAVVQSDELRLSTGAPMRWVWLRPQSQGTHPLVVYMPGAGQDAHAFEPWRHAVAEAGYVVLSWQPLPEDDALPGSAGTPHADLHTWAATRFDTTHLTQRVELLNAVMAELARAAAAGDAALQGVDLNRVALAGYELGAYTAMLTAGEHVHGVDGAIPRPTFKAYLVISPQASFEQGGFDSRYRDLHVPLLTITSDTDADPYGLGAVTYLRAAPFAGMPAGDKFLMMLRGARHADLGGRTEPERQMPVSRDTAPTSEEAVDQPSGGGRGGGGRRGGRPGQGAAGGSRSAGGAGRSGPGAAASATTRAMQASALGVVGVAFFEGYLQEDPLARDWLRGPAARWLTPVGDWSSK